MNQITDSPLHVFMILGVDDEQDPPGFYCVKCEHFWVGPYETLVERAGAECPYASDKLLTVDFSSPAPNAEKKRWFGRSR